MPLSSLQSKILGLIAANRDPESYVAGSTPLNRDRSRYSEDIDIFHDREEAVADAAEKDAAILRAAGLDVVWLRRQPSLFSAEIRDGDRSARLEWVVDSDYRFFPTHRDPLFGFVPHPVDLAMNKVMAAAGRQKAADAVDLLTIHEAVLPLGAVVWAAVEKAPGYTPEGLIAEIRRNAAPHGAADLRAVPGNAVHDPKVFHQRLRVALDAAAAFVARMPSELAGLLFLKDGRVVQPDPDRLDDYVRHAGQRRGHWPDSPDITAALLDYHKIKS